MAGSGLCGDYRQIIKSVYYKKKKANTAKNMQPTIRTGKQNAARALGRHPSWWTLPPMNRRPGKRAKAMEGNARAAPRRK